MKVSIENFPNVVRVALVAAHFLIGVVLGLASVQVSFLFFGGWLLLLAVLGSWFCIWLLFKSNWLFLPLHKAITFALAPVCGVRIIVHYEMASPAIKKVAYFVFNDEVGFRYFCNIGVLDSMESIDYLNPAELATLKKGGTLPY